ncbi:unnamed protein product [Polarella glacialis]|uniref:Anoctamin transmembrane domain-containing protein n=1 Tax=Polarella glacialis TaxID=89957 RepID=A0A813HSC6_POLGL|nr:unnamed protein product [Polarella glacialis]
MTWGMSMTWGISNVTVASSMKYLVTVNIKVVDKLWMVLSSHLTSKENWRTQADLKGAMVLKLFIVKFMVFSYPFFYTIFLKPHVEGCPGGGIDACVVELNDSLMIFFITQVVTEMAVHVIQLVLTYQELKLRSRQPRRRQVRRNTPTWIHRVVLRDPAFHVLPELYDELHV